MPPGPRRETSPDRHGRGPAGVRLATSSASRCAARPSSAHVPVPCREPVRARPGDTSPHARRRGHRARQGNDDRLRIRLVGSDRMHRGSRARRAWLSPDGSRLEAQATGEHGELCIPRERKCSVAEVPDHSRTKLAAISGSILVFAVQRGRHACTTSRRRGVERPPDLGGHFSGALLGTHLLSFSAWCRQGLTAHDPCGVQTA